jgi:hypothetical protein
MRRLIFALSLLLFSSGRTQELPETIDNFMPFGHSLRRFAIASAAAAPGTTAGYAQRGADLALLHAKNHTRLKQKPEQQLSRRLLFERRSPGGYHLRFQQLVNGIPLYSADQTVSLTTAGTAIYALAGPQSLDVRGAVATAPDISREQALAIALDYLQPAAEPHVAETELCYFPLRDNKLPLAWLSTIVAAEPAGQWQIAISATTAEIIDVRNVAPHSGRRRALVYDPNPITSAETSYGGDYRDRNDSTNSALDSQRLEVWLEEMTADGEYLLLQGPFGRIDDGIEAPFYDDLIISDTTNLFFDRSQIHFEAVMLYYHLYHNYQRLRDLGFDAPGIENLRADPHGLSGADQSHFVPANNHLAFGQGGVDDAEDADVIWHEYAHAIQEWTTGNPIFAGEAYSLWEGAADYWAASYSRRQNPYGWGTLFNWDGHNEFWSGRRADFSAAQMHYPDDYEPNHPGGQIFSSAMMEIWTAFGATISDRLFLQAHYIWGARPTLSDAAEAVVAADIALYAGEHVAVIEDVFVRRGLLEPENYPPVITHTPLGNTENTIGPYLVVAQIRSVDTPLDTTSMFLIYGYAHRPSWRDTIALVYQSEDSLFSASIAAADTSSFSVWYYLSANNTTGETGRLPQFAPEETFGFDAARDTIAPLISHTPPENISRRRLPLVLSAVVTDAYGVDSVWCDYIVAGNPALTLLMAATDDDRFTTVLPISADMVSDGDSLYYRLRARDVATVANTSQWPQEAWLGRAFVDYAGHILLVDDQQPRGKNMPPAYRRHDKVAKQSPRSADFIYTRLLADDFEITRTDMQGAMELQFGDYDLLIHSAGNNLQTMTLAAYRDRLADWVKNSDNSRLLIEGGEIGYNWFSATAFARNVLHIENWLADSVGHFSINPEQSTHWLKRNFVELPDLFEIAYDSYGDQDALLLSQDAYGVYRMGPGQIQGTDDPGIIVHDGPGGKEDPETIFMPFNLMALPEEVAADLLRNTIDLFFENFNPIVSLAAEEPRTISTFALGSNYPNPFNPSTTFPIRLAQGGEVKLSIYNTLGQRIAVVFAGELPAGAHRIQWQPDAGVALASGIYFVRLQSGAFEAVRKIMLLR